jgi:homoserine/homoserine lactone efflux protein
MSIIQYLYFVLFCFTMVFSPGPMAMLLMSIGIEHGLKRTIPAQLGASSAYLIYLVVFAIGLTAILQNNPLILKVIQFTGVSYLLLLAWKQWQIGKASRINLSNQKPVKSVKPIRLYYQGLIVGLSNPKAIVLFSIVIPQFANNSTTKLQDLVILGFTFLFLQFLSGCAYSYFGQQINWSLQHDRYRKIIYKIIALILILVAIMLAKT